MNREDLRYTLVAERELIYLERKVNELIRLGWMPLGGVVFPGGDECLMQAMTSTAKSREEATARVNDI